MRWWGGAEYHLLTAVVASGHAGLACPAGDVRLDGDTVTHAERADRRMDRDDYTGRFVS